MSDAEVSFKITSDISDALLKLNSINDKLSVMSALAVVEGIKLATQFGEVVVAAFEKVGEAIGSAVDQASRGDDAFLKLSTSMKLTGDFSEAARSQFAQFSAELARSTIYSGTAVNSALALAKSFGISNDAAESMVKAASDLAAVTGKDLNTATQELGKTYTGTAGQLGKFLPGVKNLTAAQLESGAAIDLVNQKFAGAAEAAAGTYSGALTQTKNKFDDLLETIGQFITHNTVVVELVKDVGAGFQALSSIITQNKSAISLFVTDALVGMVNSIPTIISGLTTLANVIGGVAKLLELAAGGALMVVEYLSKLALVQAIVDGVVFVVGTAVAAFIQLTDVLAGLPWAAGALKTMGVDTDALHVKLQAVTDSVLNFRDETNNDSFTKGIENLKDKAFGAIQSTDDVLASVNDKFAQINKGAQSLADSITAIGNSQADALEKAAQKMENQVKIIQQLTVKQTEALVGAGAKSPLAGILAGIDPKYGAANGINIPIDPATGKPVAGTTGALNAGAGLGALSSVLQGAAGASSLVSGAAGAVANSFLPGSGAAVTQIVTALAQGPDAVKAMVDQFAQALPGILSNVIKSLPTLIEALIDDLPQLIQAIDDDIPGIIDTLAEKSPAIIEKLAGLAPQIIFKMAEVSPLVMFEMIKSVPLFIAGILQGASGFVGQIAQGAIDFVSKIIAGAGQFVAHLIASITPNAPNLGSIGGINIGGALTGSIIGGLLTGGVGSVIGGAIGGGVSIGGVNLSQAGGSSRYQSSGSGGSSQPIQVNLKVGENDLAKVMFSMNRRGFRTA